MKENRPKRDMGSVSNSSGTGNSASNNRQSRGGQGNNHEKSLATISYDSLERETRGSYQYQHARDNELRMGMGLGSGTSDDDDESTSRWGTLRRYVAISAIGLVAMVFVLAVISTGWMAVYTKSGEVVFNLEEMEKEVKEIESEVDRKDSGKGNNNDGRSGSNKDTIAFTFKRDGYSDLPYFSGTGGDILTYKFLEDYVAVMEPYAPMKLSVLGTYNTSNTYFKYKITDKDDNDVGSGLMYPDDDGKSESVVLECTPFDLYTVKVTKYVGGEKTTSSDGNVICMYVRREVRDLNDDDLAATMDAMYTLWSTEEEEGQALYGENFHNADYFTQIHNFNAAWKDADHIHEGLGFIPQHLKMTNMFEVAMQAVDPSVSLFFWDFTIEEGEGKEIFESVVFTEEIFGTLAVPTNPDKGWMYKYDDVSSARIQDGRWANLKAGTSFTYEGLRNGYGYMRGPWNMNPSKYITRFSANFPNLPGCLNYKEWIKESDFQTFMMIAPYAPHSTTHSSIGGVYGCDVLDDMLKAGLINDEDAQLDICQKWGFWIKEMYRGDYISISSDCSLSEMDCKFICNEDRKDDMLTLLSETVQLNEFVPDNLTTAQWEQWRDFVCVGNANKIFVGDHLESASPADPSFWPIHPTQERLLQAKYMAGGFDPFTWPKTAKYGDYVCNHAECYGYGHDGEEKGYYDDCCYGHYEYDQLMDFVTGNRSSHIGPTNSETLDATDASSSDYSMPYIYSNFEWSHCGFDFEEVAEELLLEKENRRKMRSN